MIDIQPISSSSKGNCYRISDGKTPLLVDAGISVNKIRQGIGFTLSDIKGCLCGHEHLDHSAGIKNLMKLGINCYMTSGTAKALNLSGYNLKRIDPMEQFTIGTWTILPFHTIHDASEPVGFLLVSGNNKVLFMTDTAYCKYQFPGVTHMIIECNYQAELLNENIRSGFIHRSIAKRITRNHFSLDNVLEFIKANDTSQLQAIWLIHLSAGNSDAVEMKEAVQKLTGKPVYVADE